MNSGAFARMDRGDGVRTKGTLDTLNFVLAGAREGFGPFIAVYLQAQGFDPASTGIVMALAGLGGLLLTTPIGALVDASHQKRELMILSVILIAVGAVVIIATHNIWLISIAQFAIGVGDTALAPLLAAITLGIVGHAAFAERMSRNEAFNHAGNAARSAVAAVLGFFFGLQYVAVTIILSSIATIITTRFIRADSIDNVVARAGEADDTPMWRALLGMPGLLLLAVIVFIYQASSSSMLPYLAEARSAAGDDPSLTTGAMCVIARVVTVLAALLAPRIAAFRGYSGVMTIVLAAVMVRGCLAYFATNWFIVGTVEVLEGLSVGLACVAIPVLNAEVMAGTGRANAALGALLTAFGAGATVSPLIGGFVAQRFGFAGSFIAYAVVAAVGMILWIGGRWMLRNESRLETGTALEPEAEEPPPPQPVAAQ